MTIRDLVIRMWYMQPIIIIDDPRQECTVEGIRQKSRVYMDGTNATLRSENYKYLLDFLVKGFGVIDNVIVISVYE